MNVQIAAWCHFYWKDTNPGAEKFYRKLSDRAFNQVLRHKISSCMWDATTKVVTSPRAMTEMAAIAGFEQQDRVQQLTGGSGTTNSIARQNINPNVAFPFKDNFLVGTIHGANATTKATPPIVNKVVEIQDDKDDVRILTTKTRTETHSTVKVGCRVASSSNPVNGPATNSPQTETASGGSSDPASAGPAGGAAGGGGWHINTTALPSTSARGGAEQAQGGLCSGRVSTRCRRYQQCASRHWRKKADSR